MELNKNTKNNDSSSRTNPDDHIQEVETSENSSQMSKGKKKNGQIKWYWDLLLILIVFMGAYFRLVGIDWDDDHHLHPDERFLTMVSSSISSVDHLDDYFDTDVSSLNPNNRGYGFFVYGTLPVFLVRYIGEWVGQTGYSDIYLLGRFLSTLFDLLIIFLVYLISYRIYRNKILSLIASAFYAMSVMVIQLSHYYVVDNFANFFVYLAIYFAVILMTDETAGEVYSPIVDTIDNEREEVDVSLRQWEDFSEGDSYAQSGSHHSITLKQHWRFFRPYLFFGIALGMAMASKISTAPLVIVLFVAAIIYLYKKPVDFRKIIEIPILRNIFLAGVVAFLIFRIFQPYAFDGPGFFNISLNQNWISNLTDLSAQSSGKVDFPPALQWARRPLTFALENMVRWGLGLPLGILAWLAFLWMGYKVVTGEWKTHGLLWAWTGCYFVWQSINFTRSMRYQIAIYPALAIIAAWAIVSLWKLEITKNKPVDQSSIISKVTFNWNKIAAGVIGTFVVLTTFAWAFAFSRIYTRPVTRVDASEWIYQNIPAPINIRVNTDQGLANQPLPYPLGLTLSSQEPVVIAFTSNEKGAVSSLDFSYIIDRASSENIKTIQAEISLDSDFAHLLDRGYLSDTFLTNDGDPRGKQYSLSFESLIEIEENQTVYLRLQQTNTDGELSISGPLQVTMLSSSDNLHQFLPEPVNVLENEEEISIHFKSVYDGDIDEIYLPHIVDWKTGENGKMLSFQISDLSEGNNESFETKLSGVFLPGEDIRGEDYSVRFDVPVRLQKDHEYSLTIKQEDGEGLIAFYGSRQANESSWDDALPIALDGYQPFDRANGIYRTELNFEMYWDDNEEKRQKFMDTLEQADYIFITSSRQWGSTVRVPERYPMTTAFYQSLIGCPQDRDVEWCYQVAEPGTYNGNLDFELEAVFQSEPNLGNIRFNTQFAEEAFTVYDHPRVFIFKKSQEYDSSKIREFFDLIDLSQVRHLTAADAKSYPTNLMLPDNLWNRQQAGGTWSQLFNRDSIINQNQLFGVIIWYLFITLLGWMCYPFVRVALSSLGDKGYPFSRLTGMLLLALFVWLGGSWNIPFTRLSIWLAAALLAIINFGLFLLNKDELIAEIKQKKNYYLLVEGIALAFFVLFLLIRLGNPDLWHPYKGGEKPMDFSYLNAVIKSTSFPPYNPWFAGGYINYYYYGFVLVGVVVKALGIVPSIAYNFILPTLFSLFSLGAFSIGWNLLDRSGEKEIVPTDLDLDVQYVDSNNINDEREPSSYLNLKQSSIFCGITAAVASLLLGNLGTLRMIFQGFQKLAAPNGNIADANIFQHILWNIMGFVSFFKGTPFSFYPGDWYWIPSRVYQENAITEFPMFTFLYADLHAHMIALPLTLLAIAWALSIIIKTNETDKNGRLQYLSSFFLGGLVIGALRPTNTWDFPTFLVLGAIVVFYRYGFCKLPENGFLSNYPKVTRQLLSSFGSVLLLIFISFVLYMPFSYWYGQGYNAINFWEGEHADIPSYLVHWGTFLFVIASWMIWEVIDWMMVTPLSSLKKLNPHKSVILISLILFISAIALCVIQGAVIAFISIPLMVLAGIILVKPGISQQKRFVLFLVGTALFLTLMVELIVLQGDIGRMNTVFKFYLQAWTLLSISAAASLLWLYQSARYRCHQNIQTIWRIVFIFLVTGSALFTVMASVDKIRDRMADDTPLTLDGMVYMAYAKYNDANASNIDLNYDYQAILWMQENVEGSPVIVEANTPEYRWGNRFTIYTGLPGVVGWNWHQRQQLAVVSSDRVTRRVDEIMDFYQSVDVDQTKDFINRYNIQYIILGQYEKVYYPGAGLEKFAAWNGMLWQEVYRNEETTIYKVIE